MTADAAIDAAIDGVTDLDDARCVACDYPLRGLPGRRCPECGRAFDPADPAGVRRGRRPSWIVRRWVGQNVGPTLVWAAVTGVACLVLQDLFTGSRSDWDGSDGPGVLALACVAGLAAREPVRRAAVRLNPVDAPPRRASRRARRWLFITALATGLALAGQETAVWHQCPHGTQVGVFGIGLAHSGCGGPCRNAVRALVATHVAGDWYLWHG